MKNNKLLQTSIHLLAWTLVLASPFLIFWKNNEPDLGNKFLHHGIAILSLMFVFYINYFILIKKYLFNKKTWEFLLINLCVILVVSIAGHLWKEANLPVEFKKDFMNSRGFPLAIMFLIRDFISLVFTACLSVAIKITGKLYLIESQHQEEEKKRTEAELINLRQQLNPHFLFNTLNNIYSLIAISPEKAQEAVHELSKLLRYVLYENNNQFVPLQNEIDFIKYYVELMRIRVSETIDIKINIGNLITTEKLIAPMLFITLVENAFKHGISPVEPSFIHIDFRQDDTGERINCSIQNSYFPKDKTDQSGSGIGLDNLHRRLELLYLKEFELYTGKIDNTFYSKIVIPLHKADK